MSETKRRYVRHSADQWQELIEEQARSGLTQAAFCTARALSVTSFQHWKRRLKAAPEQVDRWLDLGQLGGGSAAHWEIELDLGEGLCLRLRRC
jgi:gas vesicle protein